MDPKRNIEFVGSAESLPDNQKEAILRGIDWLQNWYDQRAKMKRQDGTPLLSADAYTTIKERLSSLKVYCGDMPLVEAIGDVYQGRLTLSPEIIDSMQTDSFSLLEALETDKNVMGLFIDAEEPTILLNPDNIVVHNSMSGGADRSIQPSDLVSTTIHESSHAALFEDPSYQQNILDGVKFDRLDVVDGYWDRPDEIYARLNELRYRFHVDPTHVFTLDEVKDMRRQVLRNVQDYEESVERKEAQDTNRSLIAPESRKPFDHNIFERYTSQEILFLLNNTASVRRNLDTIDQLHQENRLFDSYRMADNRVTVDRSIDRGIGSVQRSIDSEAKEGRGFHV